MHVVILLYTFMYVFASTCEQIYRQVFSDTLPNSCLEIRIVFNKGRIGDPTGTPRKYIVACTRCGGNACNDFQRQH